MALFVAWALWFALRPRAAFVVRIKRGVPRVARGVVARPFLQDITDTCNRHGVNDGEIRGVVKGRKVTLSFQGGIPTACQQQLRNLWNLSGW